MSRKGHFSSVLQAAVWGEDNKKNITSMQFMFYEFIYTIVKWFLYPDRKQTEQDDAYYLIVSLSPTNIC